MHVVGRWRVKKRIGHRTVIYIDNVPRAHAIVRNAGDGEGDAVRYAKGCA